MDKQEKLSSTFSQKPDAPQNFAKFQQNEHTPGIFYILSHNFVDLTRYEKLIYFLSWSQNKGPVWENLLLT